MALHDDTCEQTDLMKKTYYYLTVFSILFIQNVFAQNFEWAKSFGGNSSSYAYANTVDALGNSYVTGYFQGTSDFDPGTGVFNLTSNGSADYFVQKLDASGNFLWAKSIGGSLADYCYTITVDALGNIYTSGYFQGTVDFDPGVGAFNLTSAGGFDVFIQKLDAAGNFLWAKSLGGSNFDRGESITLDGSGNVYTTGSFFGTVDFDPGAATFNLTSAGTDAFVLKLDNDGNFLMAKSFGEDAKSIKVDALGNIYTSGTLSGTADYDPGPGIFNLVSGGQNDVYVQKMDASGNFLWAKSFGGGGSDIIVKSMTIDISGNIYISGDFDYTADFDPGVGIFNSTSVGARDVFVNKLDNSGNFLWAKSFGSSFMEIGTSITVDSDGNVYTTGSFQNSVDFDPGTGNYSLTTQGLSDVFIHKMDASGNFLWAISFGGSSYDNGNSITVDGSGNIYTTGDYSGTGDYDPGVSNYNLTPSGSVDGFVQKLNQCQTTFGIDTKTECDSHLWIDGNTYYVSNNSATYTLQNAAGCDSIVTLDLIIINSATGTDTRTECNSYTWIDGNMYSSSNNTATFNIVGGAVSGCDSLVTLDLTIINSATGTDTRTECDSYTWIDGNTYTVSNNVAIFNILNGAANGCDSLVTLDLTILESTTATQTETALDSYTWSVNNETYTISGQYTAVIPNADGCDSTIMLDLTMSYTGLNELTQKPFVIYPNPANNTFQIETGGITITGVQILDLKGRELLHHADYTSEQAINVESLERGSYLVLILTDSGRQVHSLIKQ